MSETYTYGYNRKVERLEYRILNEQDLGMYMAMVDDEIESFFMRAHPSPEVDNTFHKDDDMLYRSIDFLYLTTDSEPETTWLMTNDGELAEYEPPIVPIINKVHVSYIQYMKGPLQEEYIVNIDRNDAGTKGDFVSRYRFCRYVGDNLQATVQHTDIDAVPQEDHGKYYTRDMTPYDFDEFFKDSAQINTQLRMRLVQ
jgi:hypothetical protein